MQGDAIPLAILENSQVGIGVQIQRWALIFGRVKVLVLDDGTCDAAGLFGIKDILSLQLLKTRENQHPFLRRSVESHFFCKSWSQFGHL